MLSGTAIQDKVQNGEFVITPFRRAQIRSGSYVLCLGPRFRRWKESSRPIVMWSAGAALDYLCEPFDTTSIILSPGEFVLGCTAERIGMPHTCGGFLSPLSHLARFGLGVNGGADLVSPGYGHLAPTPLTLELFNFNASPLELTVGMPIAHLRLSQVLPTASDPTRHVSVYEGQDPLVAPQFFEEWSAIRKAEDAR